MPDKKCRDCVGYLSTVVVLNEHGQVRCDCTILGRTIYELEPDHCGKFKQAEGGK